MSSANSSLDQDVEMHICATRDCPRCSPLDQDVEMHVCATRDCPRCSQEVQDEEKDEATVELKKALALLSLHSKAAANDSGEEMEVDAEGSGYVKGAGAPMNDVKIGDGCVGDKGRDGDNAGDAMEM